MGWKYFIGVLAFLQCFFFNVKATIRRRIYLNAQNWKYVLPPTVRKRTAIDCGFRPIVTHQTYFSLRQISIKDR